MRLDNIFIRALSRVMDLILLNIIWIICSIPLITIGAATTALYSVMLKIVANEEGYILKGFLEAFRSNLKQSTMIWVILVVIGTAIGADFYIMQSMPQGIAKVGTVLLRAAGIIYFIEIIFVFPFVARFENKTVQMMKNAILIPVSRLPLTVFVLVLTGGCVALTFLNQFTIMAGAVIWSLIGVAFLAFANSFFIREIFRPFTDNGKRAE